MHLGLQGFKTDLTPGTPLSRIKVAHHAGQDGAPIGCRQALGHAVAHGGHQGVGGAQVDAHGHTPLMGVQGLTGFGNLQKRHGFVLVSVGLYCPS